jgi:LuxR family maltose regulon positive regulatory protein
MGSFSLGLRAPAGYGKSTLVSHWLETRNAPSAWLWLDETDGDIRTFLSYVVAAVKTVYPEACAETQLQLEAKRLPPLQVLAGCLGNDLNNLEESFVLVLDDYQRINEPAIHELVNHLLKYPPGPLQLVVISRRDPPLLLGALRAHNSLVEIRMQDLAFTLAETKNFLEQTTGQTFSSPALARLQQSTEGWVAGLRLATLALKHHSNADAFLLGFDSDVRAVQDYLVEEVLAQQLPTAQDCLCQTAILNRFCASLCSAVCMAQCNAGEQTLCSTTFIHSLESSGLFCVALDEQGEWHRYHHLFKELLQRQLKARFTPDEITGLHRRAASWFEAHGLLDEAFNHVLQADGPAAAGHLIVRHRNEILNGERWHRLDRWLQQLPPAVGEEDPELLILKAWHLQNHGRYSECYSMLDRIEALIDAGVQEPCDPERLRGGVDALRCGQRYFEGHGDLAIDHAEQALKRLPADCLSERAYAIIFRGGALQMCGHLEQARNTINDLLSDTSVPPGTYQARLLMTLCFMEWVAADLPAMKRVANQCLDLGKKVGLEESIAIGHYFISIFHYQRNELSTAETMLLPITDLTRVWNLEYLSESLFALASVHQAGGHADQARDAVTSLCQYLLSYQNRDNLEQAEAYEADLALRQGNMADALNWARHFDPMPFEAQVKFYEPRLTQAKVLIAAGSAQSLEQAASLLARLETFYEGIHNTRFLIEVIALQALLHDAQGDESAALEALSRAVALAQPGGFIRLFVDLGPGLARLLNRLDLDAEGQRYIGRILNAFRGDEQTKADEVLDHPLTKRELEILQLLGNELSNKQISEQLSIAPATVKRHSENIYHKLAVPDRHKAVAKAKGLAIIRSH